jgi:3-methyladenine DNA glycosylase Tag
MPKARTAPIVRIPKRATPTEDVPRRVTDPSLDDHLEIITRAIFQAGLSWAFIGTRWDTFREAFEQFDTRRVAAYGTFEIDRLMHTEGVVHSEKKLAGTVANAKTLVAIEQEFGNIDAYIGGFASYAALLADARKRFAFFGDLSCYYWLFRTGNAVPLFEDWIAGQPKDHPRLREMIQTARAESTSSERAGY